MANAFVDGGMATRVLVERTGRYTSIDSLSEAGARNLAEHLASRGDALVAVEAAAIKFLQRHAFVAPLVELADVHRWVQAACDGESPADMRKAHRGAVDAIPVARWREECGDHVARNRRATRATLEMADALLIARTCGTVDDVSLIETVSAAMAVFANELVGAAVSDE